jgi:hypothetical protein
VRQIDYAQVRNGRVDSSRMYRVPDDDDDVVVVDIPGS